MSKGRWILGAVLVGLVAGASGAQAAPLHLSVIESETVAQPVQFFFDDGPPPPPVYYREPRREYYGDYPPPRAYYPPPPRAYYPPPPPRAYYAPPRARYAPPPAPPRYGYNQRRPVQVYTKDQVRGWNRANGF
jgi:hypothetical protein